MDLSTSKLHANSNVQQNNMKIWILYVEWSLLNFKQHCSRHSMMEFSGWSFILFSSNYPYYDCKSQNLAEDFQLKLKSNSMILSLTDIIFTALIDLYKFRQSWSISQREISYLLERKRNDKKNMETWLSVELLSFLLLSVMKYFDLSLHRQFSWSTLMLR